MPKEITYTAARQNLAAICNEVAEKREEYIIHRRGAEDVALISAAELRSINETAHLLRSPRNAALLLAAMDRARRGKGRRMTVEQLRRELGLEKKK